MVHDAVWAAWACDRRRRLCDRCLRARMRRMLGRELRFEDLRLCEFNMWDGHHRKLTSPGKQRVEFEAAVRAIERKRQEVVEASWKR